jgi:thiamine biosynthesis lipoprotein
MLPARSITAATLTALIGGVAPTHTFAAEPPAVLVAQGDHWSGSHAFADEFVLGTSMDLLVGAGSSSAAEHAHAVAVGEIERLRAMLSTYDPNSELSRLNSSEVPVRCSSETLTLLGLYGRWQAATNQLITPFLGNMIEAWMAAEASGIDSPQLHDAVVEARGARLVIDSDARTVHRLGAVKLNIDALGKAFIIDRVVSLIQGLPGVTAGLLNIGGDIRVWGKPALLAVADPAWPADNAAPMATLSLNDAAIATSGGYARGFRVQGKFLPHLLNPKTGVPVAALAQASVIAPDCVTANALSTALCIVGPQGAEAILAAAPSARFLAVGSNGQIFGNVNASRPPMVRLAEQSAWPKGWQVSIPIKIKSPGGRAKRPYIAVWIEDSAGKPIRTITVWGSNQKYLRDLPNWWKFARADNQLVRSVTRATRAPGQYTIAWDGLDDKGKAAPAGTYKIFMEVHREHGNHATESATLVCGQERQTGKIKATAETDEATITFGPAAR